MANEIAVSYITGATVTADVFKPAGTEREFAVSCSEAAQGCLYLGDCSSIEVGDLIVAYDSGTPIGGEEYREHYNTITHETTHIRRVSD
jgi:hypothetical protein